MKMRTEIAAGVAAAIMISLVGCGSSDVPAGPPEIEATDIAMYLATIKMQSHPQ